MIANSHYSLGAWYQRSRRTAEAIPHLEEALRRYRATETEPSTLVASVAKTLARANHDAGRLLEARGLYEESLADHILLFGSDDLRVTRLKPHVARLLLDLGDVEGAEALAKGAFERAEALTPPDPKTVAIAGSVWGACLARRGDVEAARPLLEAGARRFSDGASDQTFAARWTRQVLSELPAAPGGSGGASPAQPTR